MSSKLALLAAVAAFTFPAFASAQEVDANIVARKSQMTLLAYNLGVLGGMAQGRVAYDAAVAADAAMALDHAARVGSARMWPAGTDTMAMDGTRALPAIWENMSDFGARWGGLQSATAAMATAAGTDLASLQGAMGALGASCGGCHQTYREAQ